MRAVSLLHQTSNGSYLCAGYELRVTRRCCEEDLDCPSLDPFAHRASHEIIRALVNRRQDKPDDTRTVSPLRTGKQVYRLAYGDRHRGATWHDTAHEVVWLLAYAQHAFEGAGDAFPYFKELDTQDRLLPMTADYEDLFQARAVRLARAVPHECEEVLSRARAEPEVEAVGVIGDHIDLSCCVETSGSLEEVTVAIRHRGLTPESLAIVLASFFPDAAPADLEFSSAIAGRALTIDEVAYRRVVDLG
jgi:hypothetical protein